MLKSPGRPRKLHGCPAPDCVEKIPTSVWSCRRHWYQLPPALRASIWRAFRKGRVYETISEHLAESLDVWEARRGSVR